MELLLPVARAWKSEWLHVHAGQKGEGVMHDINEYIVRINAIVELLLQADLKQLRKLYIFISEYVKED